MGRHGYSEDIDNWSLIRWRGQVASAIRGKRGQTFLKELVSALEAMPEKKLIERELIDEDGEVCALGAIGLAKGLYLKDVDPYDHETLSEKFGIATQLVQEIEWQNDELGGPTPEIRWQRMHAWAKEQLRETANDAGVVK